ncbi:hypothetical protein GCM10010501_50690 [Streptomyces libani subsp. rufus]|nr:hypothetical protein GCM10010501_50690 [Streptomyces libani subsp. rufus]
MTSNVVGMTDARPVLRVAVLACMDARVCCAKWTRTDPGAGPPHRRTSRRPVSNNGVEKS